MTAFANLVELHLAITLEAALALAYGRDRSPAAWTEQARYRWLQRYMSDQVRLQFWNRAVRGEDDR